MPSKREVIKKQDCSRKLSLGGMRLLRKCLLDFCLDPLDVILRRLSGRTKIILSESAGRCYVQMLKMDSCIAVQKPFLSKKTLLACIQWAKCIRSGQLSNGAYLHSPLWLAILLGQQRIDYVFGGTMVQNYVHAILSQRLNMAISRCWYVLDSACGAVFLLLGKFVVSHIIRYEVPLMVILFLSWIMQTEV